MVTNPMDYANEFIKVGASGFTFHVEVAQGWLSIFMFFISLLRVGIHSSSIYTNSIIGRQFSGIMQFNLSFKVSKSLGLRRLCCRS